VNDWVCYEVVLQSSDQVFTDAMLRQCYQQLLRRPPDLPSWQAHQKGQASARDTLRSFLLSDEHLALVDNVLIYGWALEFVGLKIPGLASQA
jgi:hypothetical protein